MCQAREAGHVQHAPGAVAHVRQHERRHARPMLCQRGRDAGRAVDQEELAPAAQRPRQALHDIHVRPKVAALCTFLHSRFQCPPRVFIALDLDDLDELNTTALV